MQRYLWVLGFSFLMTGILPVSTHASAAISEPAPAAAAGSAATDAGVLCLPGVHFAGVRALQPGRSNSLLE